MQNRRKFIKQAAMMSVVLPFISNGCKQKVQETIQDTASNTAKKFSLEKFGIQLWTVRDDMAKDPKGTLKSLAEYGYNLIESFQGDKGIFWGMKPAEYAEYNKSLGIETYASHCNPEYARDPKLLDEFKKLVDDSASIGFKYLINPYLGFLKTKDEFKRITEGFNKCGEICKERGLKYAYHNHDYSFRQLEGEFPQDIMMTGSDPNLVDFEMDLYWVVTAGQDPIYWLKKYPNRFKMGHVKDRFKQEVITELEKTEKPAPGTFIGASCVLGTGQIDFNNILQVAKDQGMEYYIVEQERWENSTPMKDAKLNADYMKKFKA